MNECHSGWWGSEGVAPENEKCYIIVEEFADPAEVTPHTHPAALTHLLHLWRHRERERERVASS